LQNLSEHPDAWPFKEPVDSRDVPDYYDIIKDPIGEFEPRLYLLYTIKVTFYLGEQPVFKMHACLQI